MAAKGSHHHRTSLKQVNKKFKGSSGTKSKGRVEKKQKPVSNTKSLNRHDRKNRSKDKQAAKREQLQDTRRIFRGIDGAPKIVSIVPLSTAINPNDFMHQLLEPLSLTSLSNDTFYSEHFKEKIQCLVHPRENGTFSNFFDVMDQCLVADFVVFLLSGSIDAPLIDDCGRALMKNLMSQGISGSIFCLCNTDSGLTDKDREYLQSEAIAEARKYDPQVSKIYLCSREKDLLDLNRYLFNNYPKGISWKQNYPHLLVDNFQFVTNENGQHDLLVSGYCRGKMFNAQNYVHIPDVGDFQLESIEAEGMTLVQESMSAYQKPNSLADAEFYLADRVPINEQESEMKDIEEKDDDCEIEKLTVKVPKGTSSYQAMWYANGDEQQDAMIDEEEEDEETEEVAIESVGRKVKFADLDELEEKEQLEAFRQAKTEEQDDLLYPDEIDLPDNISASSFLSAYRGVKNLRHVDWDPYEDLPNEYENIFHFQNFKLSQKKALSDEPPTNISVGSRVILKITKVPQEVLLLKLSTKRLIVFGLLRYETNATLSHSCLTRTANYSGILKSNDSFIVSVGFRRYQTRVVFSEYNNNNAHKMLRFFQPGHAAVGSFYSCVGYPPCPVQVYLTEQTDSEQLRQANELPTLVAQGSFLEPNPLRIIAERVTLTGSPFKIFKNSSVVRFMFFNPADVNYFKPIELCTKSGRIGHIKESLGTHGYMKCVFDRQIQQNETVYLHLYKRAFPSTSDGVLFRYANL